MLSDRNRRLYIEEVPAEVLVRRFGSPLYVYSRAALLESYQALKSAFARRKPLICYAMKANSNRSVCRVLAGAGAGAEIVSGGELLRALGAGFRPESIVFSGVGKTREEMALALRKGILTINLESKEEMGALERVARRLKRQAPVSIRLNPDVEAGTHPHIATGRAHDKFGVDRARALAMYREARQSPWLRVLGIQCHIGSQISGIGPYARAARSVMGVVSKLASEGVKLSLIDFGGGMGIAYKDEPAIDLTGLAKVLTEALVPWPEARLILEPGRFLTAEAGVLLTTVLYRKESSRRRFLIVDAAMNDLARPALYGAYHPIRALGKGGKAETVDVVGPVCESGDFLARAMVLPRAEAGDVLAVLKVGAYGFSMSSQYNSRPRAAEVLVEGRKCRLVRRRETWNDLTRHEL